MIAELALAASLAAPCLAPVKHAHHHHAKPEPQQSCAVPVVPMCFKDPAPDPTLDEVVVAPYYINVPVEDDGTQGDGPYIETGGFDTTQIGYLAPPAADVPRTARAPEIGGGGAPVALTLLLGGIAVLAGRRS
jgi:hypothetical protein